MKGTLGMRLIKGDDERRFWSKVDKTGDCWLWTASLNVKGYGTLWIQGKMVAAHRWVYSRYVAEIPVGMVVDHVCHNADSSCAGGDTCSHRRCVNPTHLALATPRENTQRGVRSWRTECVNGHALTAENVGYWRNSSGVSRRCKECNRAAKRRSRERKAAA